MGKGGTHQHHHQHHHQHYATHHIDYPRRDGVEGDGHSFNTSTSISQYQYTLYQYTTM